MVLPCVRAAYFIGGIDLCPQSEITGCDARAYRAYLCHRTDYDSPQVAAQNRRQNNDHTQEKKGCDDDCLFLRVDNHADIGLYIDNTRTVWSEPWQTVHLGRFMSGR
jgi:hypothetical protein